MKELEYKVINKKAKDAKDYETMLLEMLANDLGYGIDNPAKYVEDLSK